MELYFGVPFIMLFFGGVSEATEVSKELNKLTTTEVRLEVFILNLFLVWTSMVPSAENRG
jgi:hypothetical protein